MGQAEMMPLAVSRRRIWLHRIGAQNEVVEGIEELISEQDNDGIFERSRIYLSAEGPSLEPLGNGRFRSATGIFRIVEPPGYRD
ncbi:MAG: hypothetical protein AB7G13_05305 [Lautropia sp.]